MLEFIKNKTIRLLGFCLLVLVCSCSDSDEPEVDPTISIPDVSFEEGFEPNVVEVNITFSSPLKTNLFIAYHTEEGTALAEKDFEPILNGSVTFSEGETTKNIQITLLGDGIDEEDETFEVIFSNPDINYFEEKTVLVTILNDDFSIANLAIPGGHTSPMDYPGMSLVWSDEFQGSQLNEGDWNFEIGGNGWGNNELEYYQRDNLYFKDNEYMVIQAREEKVLTRNYTSTRITTQGKQTFQFGRIDIRAVLPKGQGLWPALWMLGENFSSVGWPRCGEIDIMELVGHDPNTVHGTFHFGNNSTDKSMKGNTRDLGLGQDFSDEFHVFSLVWEEDKVEILLDDVVYNSIQPTQVGSYSYPFNQAFFFIFNVAVGGNWPGPPNASTSFPQHMIVDYVRVFQ